MFGKYSSAVRGIAWVLGDRKSMNFWYMRMNESPLSNKIYPYKEDFIKDATISGFIEKTGN